MPVLYLMRAKPHPTKVTIFLLLGFMLLPISAWSSEATLRVAFVYNFVKFINWPDATGKSFNLCALGAEGDTRVALEQINGKPVNRQAINIIYLDKESGLATLPACQMLYRPVTSQIVLPEQLPVGVVLVADEPPPTDAKVGIALIRNPAGRIEFDINSPAINRAGVTVSSQLLKLARNSHGGNHDN